MTTASVLTMMEEKLDKMGKSEEFFRQTTLDMARNIVDVISPIWPTTVLIKLKKFATDPTHMRAVCAAIRDNTLSRAPSQNENVDPELAFIEKRLRELRPEERHTVTSAALRFLKATDSPAMLAVATNVGKGIAGVLTS